MAPKRKRPNPTFGAKAALRRSPRKHEGTRSPTPTDPKPPRKKKAKTEATTSSAAEQDREASPSEPDAVEGPKTIIIEHCKQCRSFKVRAEQVKNGLEKDVAGVNVVVNPEKPRKGCFEIREEGGEVFVSLLDMKRPFTLMKELDMEKVISDIVEKIGWLMIVGLERALILFGILGAYWLGFSFFLFFLLVLLVT